MPMNLHHLVWMTGGRDELRGYPPAVKEEVGYALYAAQRGGKHSNAKPRHGFTGGQSLGDRLSSLR